MFLRLRHGFRDLSIKRKLMLIVTSTSALALVLACAGFVLHDVVTFRTVTQEATRTSAVIVGNNTTAALEFNDRPAAREALATFAGDPHVIAAILYRDGREFERYVRKGAVAPEPAQIPTGPFSRFVDGRLELAHPVSVNDTQLGTLYVVTDLGVLQERLRRYLAIAAGLLVASVLSAYVLASRFQQVISRPIENLADVTRAVSIKQDYAMRAQRHSGDELGVLSDGFNEMLAQIQQRDSALKAAHEDLERRVVERTQQLQQQIAVRITAENALQQQLTRISLLNQIASALSDRQDLKLIVQIVLAQLEHHLPADFGSVSIFNSTTEQLDVAGVRRRGQVTERSDQSLAPSGAFDETLAAFANCRTGQQVYCPDTEPAEQAALHRFANNQLRSVVAVPLIVERRFFGLLIVARVAPNAFTSGECEFLRMLAEQVAVAGSQAHLYTELQRAYTELRESQRAMMQQERLRALGQMASGIAHDINNTLTPIVTFSDILLEREPNLTPRMRNSLQHIQTAGNDIAGIVARLREFYRPRDAKEALELVDLEAVLNQLVDLTRPRWRDMPQARGAVIDLRTDFSPAVPRVRGRPTELREAITNLILNAVDAMPDGGNLTLRTRMGAEAAGKMGDVLVEVVDTGVGMDDMTRQRCLEPFFSTKGQRGTGLGLAMVYGVMERHEGRIEVESAPGKGTTMRLVFPAPAANLAESAHPFPDDVKLRTLRVLCVDDEPVLRNVLLELFEAEGHEAVAAESGDAGLALFRQAEQSGHPYDVVVTDLGMPHMDGRQFAQAIKQESRSTPVILLTGWGRIMQEQGDSPSDVDLVLSKPPRPQEMRRALRRLILGQGTTSPFGRR
jgi:signal transduction histidine kinase/ActR/RegA family two-component response regulator